MKALSFLLPLVFSFAAFSPSAALAHDGHGRSDGHHDARSCDRRDHHHDHHHDRHHDHGYSDVHDRGYVETRGRYETRVVKVWVAATTVRDWIPRTCEVGYRGRVRCSGGYTAVRTVPGYWNHVEQQVWIPATQRVIHRPHVDPRWGA